MNVTFSDKPKSKDATFVFVVFEDHKPSPEALALDKEAGGILSKALKGSHFKGKVKQSLTISLPRTIGASRVVFLGLGKEKDLSEEIFYDAGGSLASIILATPETKVEVDLSSFRSKRVSSPQAGNFLALGFLKKSWRFDKYLTRIPEEKKPKLETVNFIVPDVSEAQKLFVSVHAVSEGNALSRSLSMEPANILYPESMAERLVDLKALGIKVSVFEKSTLEKLGMGALLGVAQGSARDPRVVIMEWQGGPEDQKPLAFIGKGVTFDSGGLSLKPPAGMEEMKYDMSGAAAVSGLLKTLALRKAKVNAVGVVGLVENMPSGTAQRPGDVIKTMSGQTVEVLNTDAEGRLVLADILWYTQHHYKPQFMIDLATLTGAIVISLGDYCAGLFSNNDALSQKLLKAGEETGERVWRLPLAGHYDEMLKCDIADMKNISGGRGAGSITAAQFLKRFVNEVPWAHIDIAGVAWAEKAKPTADKGPTGFGVHLLNHFIQNNFEE